MQGLVRDALSSAKNLSAADILRQICEVDGATVMREIKVLKWVGDIKAACVSFSWDVLDYSPYSLDLTQIGFHIFFLS